MKKPLLLLLGIFFVGVLLRFYQLGSVPVGFHRDEAFFGYNAYSILKTGNDMSGEFLPIHFRSFLYSPGGYSYFSSPFIALFDLSPFSTRFASALFGSMTILLMFPLVKNLFVGYKRNTSLALLAALFVAISPWHINLSRTTTENTIVTFFIVLGILLLTYYRASQKIILLIASFFSFALTLFMYQAPRAFLPLFIPISLITIVGMKEVLRRKIILAVLFVILIVLPVLLVLSSQQLSLRISSLSILNHPEASLLVTEQITSDGATGMPFIATRVFHNKATAISLIFIENYANHFSFNHLFSDGGFPDRYRIPHIGLLYLFEIPLLIFAIFRIFKKYSRIGIFLLAWIALVPVGSSLTFDDVPNLQRTLMSLPSFAILSAFGLVELYGVIIQRWRKMKIPFVIIATGVIVMFLGYYLMQYYSVGKLYRPWYRNDGYKELVNSLNNLGKDYKEIIVTNRESAPSVLFLFYNKYDPKTFQEESRSSDLDNSDSTPFSKYYFVSDECPVRAEINEAGERVVYGKKGVLYVNSGLCKELPEEAVSLEQVKRVDGSTAFDIVVMR